MYLHCHTFQVAVTSPRSQSAGATACSELLCSSGQCWPASKFMHMQMHRAHAGMKSPSYPSPPFCSQPPPHLTCHSSTLYFLYVLHPTIDDYIFGSQHVLGKAGTHG
jgi:hypothetical protein